MIGNRKVGKLMIGERKMPGGKEIICSKEEVCNKELVCSEEMTCRNRIEISVKGLMLAVVVVIACILSAISLYMVNRGKSTINSGNNQYSAIMSDFTELDKSMYDGLEVSGDEVIRLIDSLGADKNVEVKVETLMNKSANSGYTTYCGSESKKYTEPVKSSADYINPSASFKGSVAKNANGIVETITFVQQ